MVALKKKKLHDKQALQVEHNILLLDERMVALETSAQQADLISALKAANGAIKQMQQQAPLEDVERLLSDNAESAEYVVWLIHSMMAVVPVNCLANLVRESKIC
jgi:hypothetical protein